MGHIHGDEGWTAVAQWTPHPSRGDTARYADRERLVRQQATGWARCPGALRVTVTNPAGVVVAEWTREHGWTKGQ